MGVVRLRVSHLTRPLFLLRISVLSGHSCALKLIFDYFDTFKKPSFYQSRNNQVWRILILDALNLKLFNNSFTPKIYNGGLKLSEVLGAICKVHPISSAPEL